MRSMPAPKSIEVPQALLDALSAGHLIIFAGAGVSTEQPMAFKATLYEELDWLGWSAGTVLSGLSLKILGTAKRSRAFLIQAPPSFRLRRVLP